MTQTVRADLFSGIYGTNNCNTCHRPYAEHHRIRESGGIVYRCPGMPESIRQLWASFGNRPQPLPETDCPCALHRHSMKGAPIEPMTRWATEAEIQARRQAEHRAQVEADILKQTADTRKYVRKLDQALKDTTDMQLAEHLLSCVTNRLQTLERMHTHLAALPPKDS